MLFLIKPNKMIRYSVWLILICPCCFSCGQDQKEAALKKQSILDSLSVAKSQFNTKKKHISDSILSAAFIQQQILDPVHDLPMYKCGLYDALVSCSSSSELLKTNFKKASDYYDKVNYSLDNKTVLAINELLDVYKELYDKLAENNAAEHLLEYNSSLSLTKKKVQKLESILCNLK